LKIDSYFSYSFLRYHFYFGELLKTNFINQLSIFIFDNTYKIKRTSIKLEYARVSTLDQNLDLQFNELKNYGCTTIYHEKVSGKNTDRPELKKLLGSLRKGDQVVVWKLDRLGRSLRDLVDLVALFHEQGVNFVSLHDHI